MKVLTAESVVAQASEMMRAYKERQGARERAYLERRSQEMAAGNNDMEPTWDGKRFHAPCDHYEVDDGIRAKKYMAGEFIHVPYSEEELDNFMDIGTGPSGGTKIERALCDRIIQLDEALNKNPIGEIGFSWGQAWTDKRIGQGVAHVYLRCRVKGVKELFQIFLLGNREDLDAAADAERKAEWEAAEECVEGRTIISGEVLCCQWRDNDFGGAYKMLVKDFRGFKVWGTCPQAFEDEVCDALEGGCVFVSFTATVSKSQDDSKFGFFKRPSKFSITDSEKEAA